MDAYLSNVLFMAQRQLELAFLSTEEGSRDVDESGSTRVLHIVKPVLKRRCHFVMMVGGMKVSGVPGSSKLDMCPYSTSSLLPAYFAPILPLLGPGFTDYSHSPSSAYFCCVQCNGTIWAIYPLTWCPWPCLRTFSHTVSPHIPMDTLWSNSWLWKPSIEPQSQEAGWKGKEMLPRRCSSLGE